jgi:hypothetical protein
MLDLESLFVCPAVPGVAAAAAGIPGVSGAAGRFDPGVSANLLARSAASQSKGDFTDAALRGDLGEYRPEAEIAGDAGSFMLGNTVGPTGGADIGQLELRGEIGRFVSVDAGFGFLALSWSFSFSFSLSLSLSLSSSPSQLSSDRAVVGALSICSPFSFSESSGSVEALVVLLSLLRVLLAVLVRFSIDLPVCGGEAMLGDASDMPFRKSRYATGGVMGVFWRSCSSLMVALKGPAEGRPAEGSPEDRIGSRKAELRETAERGVVVETAEGSDAAERSSEGVGGM